MIDRKRKKTAIELAEKNAGETGTDYSQYGYWDFTLSRFDTNEEVKYGRMIAKNQLWLVKKRYERGEFHTCICLREGASETKEGLDVWTDYDKVKITGYDDEGYTDLYLIFRASVCPICGNDLPVVNKISWKDDAKVI